MDLFPPLGDLRGGDARSVGRKAARLGELAGAGFPVPAGFVLSIREYFEPITTAGVREQIADLNRRAMAAVEDRALLVELCAEAATLVAKAGLVDAQSARLRTSYRAMDDDADGPGAVVAVRPSAAGEDGVDATRTNVRGLAELTEAVIACWASVFDPEAVVYRAARDIAIEPATAVIVQRMVPTQRSGLAFSADPATGDRDVVVVEAVFGQGGVVVSGEVEPDLYRLVGPTRQLRELTVGHKTHEVVRGRDGHDLTVPLGPDRADGRVLTDDEARAVARLARQVGHHLGRPVELGWAMTGRRIELLSSCPITLPIS